MIMKKYLKIKKMIGVLLPVLMIFSFSGSGLLAGGGEKISLNEAVQKGIQMDNQFKNRLLDAKISGLNQKKARMKKLFQLDFGGSYLFKSQQMEISFPESNPAPGVIVPGRNISAGAKHNYDLKFSMIQPIFSGGILNNSVKLETQQQIREKHGIEFRKIEVAGMIKSSYYTFLLLENKKESLLLLIKNLRLHLERITHLYDEELVKKTDILETNINISETELKLEELNQLLEEEKINFNRLCGLDIEDIEKRYDESMGTCQESLFYFEKHHPALKTIDQNIRMLLLKKRMVAGAYLPQVNGFAEVHYGRPGIDFFKNEWMLYFQGGINVNFKIFDWNQLKSEKTITDLSIQQMNHQKQEMITEVKKKLNQLYVKRKSLEKQLGMMHDMVKFASEDAELKKELYEEQQVSNVDYLSALLGKERYESMQNELLLQVQLVKLHINTLIGRYDSGGSAGS
jgi:outer membrane protein TolC